MQRGFHVSETIHRPLDQVWNILADPEQMSSWMPGIKACRQVSDGPIGEGTRLEYGGGPHGAPRESVVTAWVPNERLALTAHQGGISATYEYICRPAGDGTEVTLDARCTATGWFFRLMHPMIAYLMKRADRGQLRSLKELLESNS